MTPSPKNKNFCPPPPPPRPPKKKLFWNFYWHGHTSYSCVCQILHFWIRFKKLENLYWENKNHLHKTYVFSLFKSFPIPWSFSEDIKNIFSGGTKGAETKIRLQSALLDPESALLDPDFVQMPTITLMFFYLLYFLFLLYGTPSLVSIFIQIVKTITRECGELLHNIVKGHVS